MTTPDVLRRKFTKEFDAAMAMRLVERQPEIDIVRLCLLSGSHAFFIGEPGTAKSMSVDAVIDLIDPLSDELDKAEMILNDALVALEGAEGARKSAAEAQVDEARSAYETAQEQAFLRNKDYWYNLFMKSTPPEMIFGPLDLSVIDHGVYRTLTEGYLPRARIAFSDEVFKAGAPVLTPLLLITNERKFKNGAEVEDCPLHCMFYASNELPESDDLAAVFDRITFKREVEKIKENGNMVDMLKIANGGTARPQPVFTWMEIMEAYEQAQQVVIPNEVFEALVEVRDSLKAKGIHPSDRKFAQALKVIKAAAWLDGADEADVEHLRPLEYVLFEKFEEYNEVRGILYNLANPFDKKIQEIISDVEKAAIRVNNAIDADEGVRIDVGTAEYRKMKAAKTELKNLKRQIVASKRKSALFDTASRMVHDLTLKILSKLFGDEDDTFEADEFNAGALDDETGGDV